jgi:hypothetical protein
MVGTGARPLLTAERSTLAERGRQCERFLTLRMEDLGALVEVETLENATHANAKWTHAHRHRLCGARGTASSASMSSFNGCRQARAGRLALVVRGQAYRGRRRDIFYEKPDAEELHERVAAQRQCAASLMRHAVLPYEESGHRVSVFLTIYRELGGPLEHLINAFEGRVVSVNTLHTNSTPSQVRRPSMRGRARRPAL